MTPLLTRFVFMGLLFLAVTPTVFAQSQNQVQSPGTITTSPVQSPGTITTNPTTLVNPLGAGTSLPVLIDDILKIVVRIGSVIIIFMLVYVGYKFVVARGEPGEISEARNALMWTVVGALILLGAQAIALGIQATVDALSVGN